MANCRDFTDPREPLDLDEIRGRHSPDDYLGQRTSVTACACCKDAIRLCDEVERQDDVIKEYIKDGTDRICEIASLRDEVAVTRMQMVAFKRESRQADEVITRLREALEGIVLDDTHWFECQDIARTALKETQ